LRSWTADSRVSGELISVWRSSVRSWSFMSDLAQWTAAAPMPNMPRKRPIPSNRFDVRMLATVSPGGTSA
jgi:hypothetical protein